MILYGAPRRSRTLNLLIRSQPLYPIELEVLIVNSFISILVSFFNEIVKKHILKFTIINNFLVYKFLKNEL